MSRPLLLGPATGAALRAWPAPFRSGVRITLLATLMIGSARAQPVSQAEVLLFETDHLARMQAPVTLVYEFRKLSNVEPAFTDSVQLDVSRAKGQVHAALRFLTGERTHALPEIDDAHGNPVLLGFLEHDIAEMKRLTGGSTGYFRKRIRMALANGAQVTPQRISYQGKMVDGKAVRIQPYLDDPMHARFEHYVRKTYTFVVSEEVPGGIYQVSTSLANDGDKKPAAGTVVARTAATSGTTQPGATPAGTAQSASGATPATGTRSGAQPIPAAAGAAQPGSAAKVPGKTAPTGAAGGAGPGGVAQAGMAAPGAAAPGAATLGKPTPVIDETLTLIKVVAPQR